MRAGVRWGQSGMRPRVQPKFRVGLAEADARWPIGDLAIAERLQHRRVKDGALFRSATEIETWSIISPPAAPLWTAEPASNRPGRAMFKKILIANRGEIACRVIKTARRMGIATVAVYSDADKDALHVEMADEAVHIGPAPAAQSYLVIDKIVAACKATGAEAVHPGYGFLSERAAFAQALETAGIIFIGPNPRAIEAMGDKIESKKFANAAKVSTVPGYLGVIEDADHADEDRRRDRLSGDDQGLGRRRRQGHAHRPFARRGRGRFRPRANPRRNPHSATIASSSKNSSSIRATSKSRCSATSTAT